MKMVEYQHRNEGGGNMVQLPNETFDHGELVMIVSRTELYNLLLACHTEIEHKPLKRKLMEIMSRLA